MGVEWTKEQQQVIQLRDRNILVSAAAGSGKTAVLVERIIQMISDQERPVDIDRLLVVTFTNAAAGEMRERIREAIENRLYEEPDNVHLQRQATLIHNAQIMTIHSFCQYIIRNYFFTIDLDPGFRVGDEGEMKLLRNEVAEQLLEEAYEKKDPDFEKFIETYAPGKSDNGIIEYLLQVYEFSMSFPWPDKWLEQCKEAYRVKDMKELEQTSWMRCLLANVDLLLGDIQVQIEDALKIIRSQDGPFMYEPALEADKSMVDALRQADTYEEYSVRFGNLGSFVRLSGKRNADVSERKKEMVKSIREQVKKSVQEIQKSYFYADAGQILHHLQKSGETAAVLLDMTAGFLDKFTEKKREKGLLDFHDMEHLALTILVDRNGGDPVPTETARNLSNHYMEIMIDEYQDSNLVQELILTSVSGADQGKYNIFMVGDVKQSIYRFRLARPELFMDKYSEYSLKESKRQRIDLHKNFRSRSQVLESVNFIFDQIMADYLGKIDYDDAAALYPGAMFPEGNRAGFAESELLLLDIDEETEMTGENARELEARMIAGRIQRIVQKELVLDKKTGEYRPAQYRDIVILLRTISGWAEAFSHILEEQGIPCYTGSKTGYFTAVEIQTILSLLKIIDNPRQEIPMAAILASPIAGLSTRELALIKCSSPGCSYYEACLSYAEKGEDTLLQKKLIDFFEILEDFRSQVPYTPMHELLMNILKQTGYGDYAAAMPAGEQRQANITMLIEKAIAYENTSYKGLFNFIRYIENLQKYNVDFGEASILGEEENTVRIMSIHKSKGLEFPIVFAAGLSKQFNRQDIRSRFVMHQDLGLGSDFIDPENRLKIPTLLKKTLQREVYHENLGEELRVLYVALTRAKEKLIMTGAVKGLENMMKKWNQACKRNETKLSFSVLSGASAYLDWIMPCVLRHRSGNTLLEQYGQESEKTHPLYDYNTKFDIQVFRVAELVTEESKNQLAGVLNREMLLNWDAGKIRDDQVFNQLENNLNMQYPYEKSKDVYGKVTVSELKRKSQAVDTEEEFQMYQEPQIVPYIPEFMKKDREAGGAVKGTVYHKFLEYLDFLIEPTAEAVQGMIQQSLLDGRLTEEEIQWIQISKIVRFLNSDLGHRMKRAAACGQLYREQPFMIGVNANEVQSHWETDDLVLIQGIIDAYFYEGESIVLVDYKTDVVRNGNEKYLLEKYRLQLEYYTEALQRLSGKEVKDKMIYSFYLEKELRDR